MFSDSKEINSFLELPEERNEITDLELRGEVNTFTIVVTNIMHFPLSYLFFGKRHNCFHFEFYSYSDSDARNSIDMLR